MPLGPHLAASLWLGRPVVGTSQVECQTVTWIGRLEMSDNHLNAQQLQRIQQDASAALQAAIDRMQLRKWSVEQAFAAVGSTGNPMQVARDIYDFVSQAAVVKVDVDWP